VGERGLLVEGEREVKLVNNWISVEDELPEPSGVRCWQGMALSETVLIVIKHPRTHKPWIRLGKFAHDVDFDGVYIEGLYDFYPATITTAGATLWMPLPELLL
jgi:hypothetical protein